ncbi:hypothetical protein AB0C31_42925 [Actinoplanes philippinensis]
MAVAGDSVGGNMAVTARCSHRTGAHDPGRP